MSQKRVLSKFMILCWATFIAIMGCFRAMGRGPWVGHPWKGSPRLWEQCFTRCQPWKHWGSKAWKVFEWLIFHPLSKLPTCASFQGAGSACNILSTACRRGNSKYWWARMMFTAHLSGKPSFLLASLLRSCYCHTHSTSDTGVWGVVPAPAGCPTVQLNSDTVCLETGWGLNPAWLLPPYFKWQSQVQVVTCASDRPAPQVWLI